MAFLDPKKTVGLKVPVLKNVLTEPDGIKTGDLFPQLDDLRLMHRYMHPKMGIAVDSVSDVPAIRSSDVQSIPGLGTGGDSRHILGMVQTDGGINLLLDIEPSALRESLSPRCLRTFHSPRNPWTIAGS